MSDYSSSSAEEAVQTAEANSQDNKSSMPLSGKSSCNNELILILLILLKFILYM